MPHLPLLAWIVIAVVVAVGVWIAVIEASVVKPAADGKRGGPESNRDS